MRPVARCVLNAMFGCKATARAAWRSGQRKCRHHRCRPAACGHRRRWRALRRSPDARFRRTCPLQKGDATTTPANAFTLSCPDIVPGEIISQICCERKGPNDGTEHVFLLRLLCPHLPQQAGFRGDGAGAAVELLRRISRSLAPSGETSLPHLWRPSAARTLAPSFLSRISSASATPRTLTSGPGDHFVFVRMPAHSGIMSNGE
jgi:hypothetical protein